MTRPQRMPQMQQPPKQVQRQQTVVNTPDENELLQTQEAKFSPDSLSPASILRLQRTIGNHNTIKMIQKQRVSAAPVIQRGKEGEQYAALADEDELEDQDAPAPLVVGPTGDSGKVGAAKSAKSGVSAGKGVVEAVGDVAEASAPGGLAGMAGVNHAKGASMLTKAKALGAAFTDAPDASDGALQAMLTPLDAMKDFFQDAAVQSIAGVFGVVKLIYDTYSKYKKWNVYDRAAQAAVILVARESDEASADESLLTKMQDESGLSQAVVYAAAKTKRGFFTLLFRSIMKVAQYIGRMITLFTGGIGGIAGEAIDLGAGLTVAAEKGARAAKGFFKAITGKRGKNRTQSANTVVDEAMGGDANALQLMIDLSLFGLGWKAKLMAKSFMTAKAGGLMGKLGARVVLTPSEKAILVGEAPKTPEAMTIYLLLCQKVGILKDVKEAVSGSMKSQ